MPSDSATATRDDRSFRPDSQARFLREAKSIARLDHPNVVRIYEVGTHEGRVFLALEYVEGRTLREWVLQDQPSVEAIIDRYLDAGRALEAAPQLCYLKRVREIDPASLAVVSIPPRRRVFGLIGPSY